MHLDLKGGALVELDYDVALGRHVGLDAGTRLCPLHDVVYAEILGIRLYPERCWVYENLRLVGRDEHFTD